MSGAVLASWRCVATGWPSGPLIAALALLALASGCGSADEDVDVAQLTTSGPTAATLRTDTRGEDAYAGVTFEARCRAFAAAKDGEPFGIELPLPRPATLVVLKGPAGPISIQGTKIALRTVGEYTVACQLPAPEGGPASAALVDATGARLEVVPGPASAVHTRLRLSAAPGALPASGPVQAASLVDSLSTKAGAQVQVWCSGTDAWGNALRDGWSVEATPKQGLPLGAPPATVGTTAIGQPQLSLQAQLLAKKAGSWQVTCRNAGVLDDAPAQLTVKPNVPRHLFTLLDPGEIAAGDAAKLGCVATDAYGNAISGFPFALDFPSAVQIKGLYASSTVAGIHTLKCVPETDKWSLYELHAATLIVRPGPAKTLIVSKVPDKPVYKREEKVKFPATVQDAWGNVRPDDPVTVAVLSPAKGWKILEADPLKDKIVRFAVDGTYTLSFSVQPAGLTTEVKLLVDGAPPLLTIEDPAWGSTLTGKPSVQIKGKAGDAGSGIKKLTVNGKQGFVDGANAYLVQQGAKHGLNLVFAQAEDMGGEVAEATRGFYFSNHYYNTDAGKPRKAMVKDAVQIFIGAKMLDDGDHDPNKPNDFATILELLVGSSLTAGLTPSSQSQGSMQVTLSNTQMGKPHISLKPVAGALDVKLRIDNVSTDLKVKAKIKLGPIKTSVSVSGNLKMSAIRVDMRLKMAVTNGKASASVASSDVTIDGMKLSINGIGGLFNPLFNLLLKSYKSQIEQQLKAALVGDLPKLLNQVLSQLSTTSSFDVPGSSGNAPTVKVTLVSDVKTLAFTPAGALLKIDASFVAAKGTKHTILGAIARAGCVGTSPDKFVIDQQQRMQFAMHDDLINQLLYAIWYGGGMTMTIPGKELGSDKAAMGLSLDKATLDVDLLLPPILEGCPPPNANAPGAPPPNPNAVRLQIGDIFSTLRIPFGSEEMALYLASSLDVPAEIVFGKDAKGGSQVKVVPGKSVDMLVELTDISKTFAAQKATFAKLIKDAVAKQLAKGLPGGDKLVVPLPASETDLSTMAPGIPKGTVVKTVIKGLKRASGYTAISMAFE